MPDVSNSLDTCISVQVSWRGNDCFAKVRVVSSSSPGQPERALGLLSLVCYGLAYIAPVTVLATYGVASAASGGRLVISYALAMAAMLLTASSFGILAREFPVSGSVYAYAARTLHPIAGLFAGWALLLDYLLIPTINLILIGLVGSSLIPAVPPPAWMLGVLVTTTALNLRGIKTTDRAAIAVLAVELGCIAAFCLTAAVVSPMPVTTDRPPLTISAVLGGAGLLALSFLGFDAVTALADEAKNPRRDIPRAVISTCFFAGLLFCGVCWLAFRAYPVSVFENVEIAGYVLAEAIGGRQLGFIVAVGFFVGGVASALTSQAAAARLLFGMSRQTRHVAALSRLHPVRRTPDVAIMLVAVLALLSFVISLNDAVSIVNFGALASFLIVHASVIGHGMRHRTENGLRHLIRTYLLPLLGIITTGALMWGLSTRAKIIGVVWLLLGLVVGGRGAPQQQEAPIEEDSLG